MLETENSNFQALMFLTFTKTIKNSESQEICNKSYF